MFFLRRKFFLRSSHKRKEHRKLADFLWQNEIINELGSYILKIMLRLCLCKQTNICVSVQLHVSLRKVHLKFQ